MGGIEDYIKWRGDLTFEQSAFNEVDNLVLSQIAYVDFKNIIPAAGSKEKITLRQAAHDFFDLNDEEELQKVTSFIREAPFFMRIAAGSSLQHSVRNFPMIRTTLHFAGQMIRLSAGKKILTWVS